MSPTGIAANRLELLQIADAVAREKSIDREVVIAAIEEAIQKGARARYGAEHDIRVRGCRRPCGTIPRPLSARRTRKFFRPSSSAGSRPRWPARW